MWCQLQNNHSAISNVLRCILTKYRLVKNISEAPFAVIQNNSSRFSCESPVLLYTQLFRTKKKSAFTTLSQLYWFLQILNMKNFPGRGCWSHGGHRGDKGAVFITLGMSLLISVVVKTAFRAAPHPDGSLLLRWEKGCTTSVASHAFLFTSVTKCKEKKMQHVQNDLLNCQGEQLTIIWSEEFICMLGAFCAHICLCFKGLSLVPKEAEGCTHL